MYIARMQRQPAAQPAAEPAQRLHPGPGCLGGEGSAPCPALRGLGGGRPVRRPLGPGVPTALAQPTPLAGAGRALARGASPGAQPGEAGSGQAPQGSGQAL